MATTEQSRNRLRTYLEETMGEEQASAMMDHLLPVGWTDLATSREVTDLRDGTTREFKTLRAEMAGEFKAVRAEMAGEFKAVRADVARLRDWATVRFDQTATRADIAEVRIEIADLRTELHRGFRRQTFALIGLTITLGATMTAALRF